MIETLTEGQVIQALRQDNYANWSYKGAKALTEYLFELEEENGEQIELDPIAWRCEFTEYDSLEDWAKSYYGDDLKAILACEFEEEYSDEWARNEIRDNGTLIEFEGGIIVSEF